MIEKHTHTSLEVLCFKPVTKKKVHMKGLNPFNHRFVSVALVRLRVLFPSPGCRLKPQDLFRLRVCVFRLNGFQTPPFVPG